MDQVSDKIWCSGECSVELDALMNQVRVSCSDESVILVSQLFW